jgi:hypothetical protein
MIRQTAAVTAAIMGEERRETRRLVFMIGLV